MVTPIRRDEVQRLVEDEGGQLVEVLPPPEYESEHIEGAINIPLKPESTEGRPWGQPLKKLEGAPLNLG